MFVMLIFSRATRLLRAFGLVTAAVIFCLMLSTDVARSQDSRAVVIAQQQAAKAKQIAEQTASDPKPKKRRFFIPKVAPLSDVTNYLIEPRGFYPLVGSIYSGGGASFGGGYRWYYGDETALDIKGMYSIKNYKWGEISTASPGDGLRPRLRGRAGWRDATQVAFYGVGNETDKDDRSNFRLQNLYAGGDAQVEPVFPFVFTGGVMYENYTTKEGQGRDPSIETEWTPALVTGLGVDPRYVHSQVSGAIDWRPAAGYARTGGLYEVGFHDYHDLDGDLSFNQMHGEVVQHIPLIREKYVISLHGRVETVLGDDTAPFFLLPSLGSGSTLRAYSSWRFRDRHSMLLQAEWRWIPNRYGLDMAFFYDAGKVAAVRDDLTFDNLTTDYGIGVRFHGPAQTPIRVELANGSEGLHLVFAGSAAF
jgi:hypothetical protein